MKSCFAFHTSKLKQVGEGIVLDYKSELIKKSFQVLLTKGWNG